MHTLVLRAGLAVLMTAPPETDPPPVQRPTAVKPVPRSVNPPPTPAAEPTPTPTPAPSAEPTPAAAPNPEPGPGPTDPTTGDDPGLSPAGAPLASRPGPAGSGMIIGGIALAGPGLVIGLIGLVATALTTSEGNPTIPIMLGAGGAMLVGGGVLAGFGFKRNLEHDRWVKATGVRPPRSGHGLIVGGGIAAAAGISMIAWQADVARRSPAGEVCNGAEGCQTPRSDAMLGIAVGVLVLGGAGTLLGIGIKRKLKYDAWMRVPVLPSATLLPGGAGLSLSGRF